MKKTNDISMKCENYKITTWEELEDQLLELASSFGNDYYSRAYDRVNQSFNHDAYKSDKLKHYYMFFNKMKETIVSIVLEDTAVYPFIANNTPFTDADKRISPTYNPECDFHDAFTVVNDRYIGIEFKCRTHFDKLKHFDNQEGIVIVGKAYERCDYNPQFYKDDKGYKYTKRPYKLGGVLGCSRQKVMKGSMYHYEDRENLVARNYAYYLRNVRNLKYEVDGTIDEVSYNIDLNNQVQEYHSIESFQSLGIMDPAFHLVYNVGNHICIYNMNYLSSDYINGYIKTYIDYKPSSTQMKKQILPYDVLEVPLNLVDQYIIEDGKIIKYIPRDSKLITEELKVLPLINEEVPNDPNSRLEWNYRNFTISKDKDIIDAQITHGGHNVDTIELSYDEMVILANAELIAG